MTTTVFFVRHVPHEHQGRIHVGRMEGVQLAEGSAERLAELTARFAGEQLDAVYASPVLRTQLTAAAVANGLEVRTLEGLTEIDAVRCAKLAMDRGQGGALVGPSSWFMKSPPEQFTDEEARERTLAFIDGREF